MAASSSPAGNEADSWDYSGCPKFSSPWNAIQQAQTEGAWPQGYRVANGRLLHNGLWCIPTGREGQVLRAHHEAIGHQSAERLWKEASRHYTFADEDAARAAAKRIPQQCETCQACEHPHQPLRLRITSTPVPPHPMSAVSIDLFVMPEITEEDQKWNVFAAAVDRHSGWCIATPHHTRGLTAAKVAKEMFTKWWSPHGIPSCITSDRGPHFAGAWWRSMCALHGVRQSFSQAYHKEGNGRAERIGSQLQVKLRKLQADEGIPWTEALQRAVNQHNDQPGPTGLSPFEILFGRQRPLAGVPIQLDKPAEDAIAFFKRQADVDSKVAAMLNEIHRKQDEQVNRRRRELAPLKVGDKAWYLRPRGGADNKLDSYWIGPCVVKERRSEHSYVLEVKPGHLQEAHRSQLKEHIRDEWSEKPLKLFHFRRTEPELKSFADEWAIEDIEQHRIGSDGYPEFLVRWEGSAEKTWEPLRHFFLDFSHLAMSYCVKHKLKVPDMLEYLHRHPAEVQIDQVQRTSSPGPSEWEDPPAEWTWPDEAAAVPRSQGQQRRRRGEGKARRALAPLFGGNHQ